MFRCHAIQEKAASCVFTNRRSVFDRFTLNEGRYVIIPSTFDPAYEREFLLRIFTEISCGAELVRSFSPFTTSLYTLSPLSRLLKKDVPGRGILGYMCFCCVGAPKALVTVHLDTAQDLGAGKLLP